jgi:hypothetical protein
MVKLAMRNPETLDFHQHLINAHYIHPRPPLTSTAKRTIDNRAAQQRALSPPRAVPNEIVRSDWLIRTNKLQSSKLDVCRSGLFGANEIILMANAPAL